MSDIRKHEGLARFTPSSIRTGGLMLLVMVVAVFLAVLCVLCVQLANTTQAQSEVYAQTTTETFVTEKAANMWLSKVDAALEKTTDVSALKAALPEGSKVDSDTISAVIVGNEIVAESDDTDLADSSSIADGGLKNTSSTSSIELKVCVRYKGSSYTVTQWEKSRIYE